MLKLQLMPAATPSTRPPCHNTMNSVNMTLLSHQLQRPLVHVDVIPDDEYTVMLRAFVDFHVTPPITVALNTKTRQHSARMRSESDVNCKRLLVR